VITAQTIMQSEAKVKLARDMIPATDACVYLSTGSLGPVSLVFAETLRSCLAEDIRQGRALPERYERMQNARERVREEFARLVSVDAGEIVLTQNTTDALAAVINEYPWQTGDEVISTQLEHEACRNPLEVLAEKGRIRLRIADVPTTQSRSITWLTDAMTPRTRLVAFSGTAFINGQRLPIEQIVAAAAERDVRTLLDGAQSAGAIPLNLDELGVDFCAMPLQKWLCGAEGIGALFVRRGLTAIPRIDRVTRSWGEFEAAAVHLEWLRTSLGWQWIHERTALLAAYGRQQVSKVPHAELLTPESHAGLVTFSLALDDTAPVASALRKDGFVFRHLEELKAFRISTAFFNTTQEIDAFLDAVAELAMRVARR
jgi:L-cysteine/cystine lyase